MPNIQVIDGAENCTYDIFEAGEDDFRVIFPELAQDIEFVEDLVARLGEEATGTLLARIWTHPVDKKVATGIQGTLFFQLSETKRPFYPTKRESEMVTGL